MDEQMFVKKLLDHDLRFDRIEERMATKDDIAELKQMMEKLTTMVAKIQEDQLFAIEWLKRMQDQVDKQAEDIRQIASQTSLTKLA